MSIYSDKNNQTSVIGHNEIHGAMEVCKNGGHMVESQFLFCSSKEEQVLFYRPFSNYKAIE
jgi:hypothetical protein